MALYLGENKIAGGGLFDDLVTQTITIDLPSVSWTKGVNGVYYANMPNTFAGEIVGVDIGDWSYLAHTPPTPTSYDNRTKLRLISDYNTFPANSWVEVLVTTVVRNSFNGREETPHIYSSVAELLPYLQTAGATKSFVCSGTVTSYLTNGAATFVGKFNAFRVSDEYIDWFGTVSNGMYCGRLSRSGNYQSHRVILAHT